MTGPSSSGTYLELEDVAAEIRGLASSWENFLQSPDGLQALKGARDSPSAGTTATIIALASHTTDVATSAIDLIEDDKAFVAMPLIRAAFESGLTAHWLAKVPDAIMAFVNAECRSRRNLVRTMKDAQNPLYRDRALALEKWIIADLDTKSGAPARNFSQLCDDFELAANDAYVLYRRASMFSHPSLSVADRYLDLHDNDGSRISIRSAPRAEDARAWAHVLAASLIWAQMAANFSDSRKQRRSELRAVARRIGTPADLKLSGACWKRLNKK